MFKEVFLDIPDFTTCFKTE